MKKVKKEKMPRVLEKVPTNIFGLDEILGGGIPKGRPTLVCGGAGCGKTLLAMEFLIKGALNYNEPGVFVAFEETEKDLIKNVSSLGYDLDSLIKRKIIEIDYVYIERNEIEVTGEYDLEGLFIRLEHSIKKTGAKRVVLDSIESLFAGLPNHAVLRAELRRLFGWLKDRNITAIITGERGDNTYTRQGLEEYVSDCVILLDHRIKDQLSTRRIRVVKYRGSAHGSDEYPFIIDNKGFSVLPVTSIGLNHKVSPKRISSGIKELDEMMGGKGFYKGSSVLLSGTAGIGKSSIAAHFINAACSRGEKALYFVFEESPYQISRNMLSIGIDLMKWEKKGLLQFHATRPTLYGLEKHLTTTFKTITEYNPDVVVFDPINTYLRVGTEGDVKVMIIRLVDFLKMKLTTCLFTNLTNGDSEAEKTDISISSLIDTWIVLRDIELNGERNRGLFILKSRGMRHSNQIREFTLSEKGVNLKNIYVGPGGVLTGSARVAQEAEEKASRLLQIQEADRKKRTIEIKRNELNARIEVLKSEFRAFETEANKEVKIDQAQMKQFEDDRKDMAKSRSAR